MRFQGFRKTPLACLQLTKEKTRFAVAIAELPLPIFSCLCNWLFRMPSTTQR